MEEKEIITSEIDKLLYINSCIFTGIGLLLTIAVFCDGGLSAWMDYAFEGGLIEILISWGGLFFIIIGIVLFIAGKNCKITVTNKRVYGIARFNARVDIPLDSVSAIGTISLFKGISVSSSSGLIKFWYIKNVAEIHKAISDLIIKRSSKQVESEKTSNADELKKFKDLFDQGIITQEEFDLKKKQLLGL